MRALHAMTFWSAVLAMLLASVGSASAQVRRLPPPPVREPYPAVSPRGFVMFGQERFTARQTFETIFGESVQPIRGGGADVVIARNFFAELTLYPFEKTGERVYRFGNETFKLGIPLTAKITPLEITGGYRLTEFRRVIPYGGVGFGTYRYEESSDFDATGEGLEVSKNGFILTAGAEVRLMRWVGVTVDVRRTRIENIIGADGISKEFNENDLGGTSIRFRIMIGR
jgi:opacity protein-like surface antigen